MNSSARRRRGVTAQESSGIAAEGEAAAPAGPAGVAAPDEDDGEGPGIAAEADAGEPAARRTAVVEQCCAWGGEQRLRLRLTLSVGPGARGLNQIGQAAEGWGWQQRSCRNLHPRQACRCCVARGC